ncbi:sensor histidine kinase [Nesterenkonia xinjiangensis]|uniref:Two-component system sensor histidine kinase DesK n=1 Tax=Nesterenkonia xinjiangensis TaxID=225327 RepID=A0A7Z0K997_9MICC|nr:histidine kinase [Nesterenkonia xinjiangensis]NYJ77568.1 two-component system sensor histidine kinase DesK [Nesterenkonia xinjiangensis]
MNPTQLRPYDAEASYRRMHRTTVVTTMVSILPVGIILIAVQAQNWWEAAVVGVAFVASVCVMTQWGRSGYPRFGTAALIVCVTVWGIGAVVFGTSMAFFPLALVGSMTVPRLPRHRAVGTVGFGLLTAVIGAAAVWRNPELDLLEFSVVPGVIAVFVTAMMLYSDRYWVILHELEQARTAEAELGIMRERVRFASELHDIQGHTLHVVKLKVALAEKLMEYQAGRAARELREVHELVADTITQTKELAYAQRRLNLASELENTKNLFEAASIEVQIRREDEEEAPDDSPYGALFGQVLRETTTNILRHAQATRVEIELCWTSITVINDGARPASGECGSAPGGASGTEALAQSQLRGLNTLKQRIADNGGELQVNRRGSRFSTAAYFPQETAR